MGAVQGHWGRECEPGPRSPEANFRLGKRQSGCRAGALLVWAAAYLGLEETAGDTVNRGRAASLGWGRPCDPPKQPGVWQHSLIKAFVLDLQQRGSWGLPWSRVWCVCVSIAGGGSLCQKWSMCLVRGRVRMGV